MSKFYESLFTEIAERSVQATLGVLGIRNPQLRKHIEQQLGADIEKGNRILADPVFESAFPWQEVGETFEDLANRGFLQASLVAAMDAEHKNVEFDGDRLDLSEQALKKDWSPRTHQLESWEILTKPNPKSLVVTSGTGSGKTECFMIPILNDLVRQQESGQRLEGVQALFIYPLNALINSQRERILSWTLNYRNDLRFCLYNGNTPKVKTSAAALKTRPTNEVYDRPSLWQSPPPILITNPTMLEYMLIRSQDRPILNISQGKLKYIVLDEAHTYIGSQAAELALLIRRVLNGFGVEAEQVRFIATSATIGSDREAKGRLKKYLADIAGISPDMIEVVDGSRHIPQLEQEVTLNNLSTEELSLLPTAENIDSFYNNQHLRKLRHLLSPGTGGTESGARKLSQLTHALFPGEGKLLDKQRETLQLLDLASQKELEKEDVHFLPLRGHYFHKVLHGLWACCDSNCLHKQNTRLAQNWNFGKVYSQQRLTCECGAPVYELVFCNECSEPHLKASIELKSGQRVVIQVRENNIDEFEIDIEDHTEEDIESERGNTTTILIYPRSVHGAIEARLDATGRLGETSDFPYRLRYNNLSEDCSSCGFGGEGRREAMRHAYLGMPFYTSNVVPTLLEHVADGNNPLNQPFRGRRLLTFTDSRQGTAKIAIKIQQDSERLRTRGLIRRVLDTYVKEDLPPLNTLLERRTGLLGLKSDPVFRDMLSDVEAQISDHTNLTISFDEVVRSIQDVKDIESHLKKSYKSLDPQFNNLQMLTQLLMVREFSRRPRRGNSLETLGLVALEYEKLNGVTTYPTEFERAGFQLKDWKDFLKVALDFYIRDSVFLDINRDWLNWLGGRFIPKLLLSPNSQEEAGGIFKKWPQFDPRRGVRQQRLSRLLAHAFSIDLVTINAEDIDRINSVLEQAWNALRQANLLEQSPGGNGFHLKLRSMSFKKLSEAWVCPITMRFLDTTFRGTTPYLPTGAGESYHCERISLPMPPAIYAENDEHYRGQIRAWLKTDAQVRLLRERGLWTDQSDRVMEGGYLVRSAEHSAQQHHKRLKRYESDFKAGKINVLSCSTTMEMGVDIGGLSVVCNNNVPPHPSNYLQRAGRAGRRGESRALSFTLCKNNTLEQQVFQNPLWAFEARMKQPNITLSSERIVKRHINAYLFGYFLNNQLSQLSENQIMLKSDWFFEGSPSVCDQLIEWIEKLDSAADPEIFIAIDYIRRQSVLDGHDMISVLRDSVSILQDIKEKWVEKLNYYLNELAQLSSPVNPAYKSRIDKDVRRHREVYLLSALISGGFLPGYGFPTDIASFNPETLQDFLSERNYSEQEREDLLTRVGGKPTRNLAVALGEYAPGSQIVIDGRVFTSRGITLNFQTPDDNIVNSQNFKLAWRCGSCGKSGIREYGNIEQCDNPDCPDGSKIEFFEYIVPSGFATSYYDRPTNNISQQKIIQANIPWINTHAEIRQFPNPALGHFISDKSGEIFYHNKGEHQNGFAVCLSCGHAQSMSEDGGEPSGMNHHDRLRGRNAREGELKACNPGPNAIRCSLSLGFVSKTDVFELYLKHSTTGEYFIDNEDNKKLAWSLGVALRHGLASALGVNSEELGINIRPIVNQNLSSSPILVIALFDTNCGGSGFATLAAQPLIMREMFCKAKELVACSSCEDACQNCLLQFDTKKYADLLDKNIARSFLTEELINTLGLPDEERILGVSSQYCLDGLFRELKYLGRGRFHTIQMFLGGNSADWSVGDSPIRTRLGELIGIQGKFSRLELVMERENLSAMSHIGRMDLYNLMAFDESIQLIVVEHLPELVRGNLLASLQSDRDCTLFASTAEGCNTFNENWANTQSTILVKAEGQEFVIEGEIIEKDSLLPVLTTEAIQICIGNELNGTLANFGRAFWNIISIELTDKGIDTVEWGGLQSVYYSDRYLASPITVILLTEILKHIPFVKGDNLSADLQMLKSNYSNRNASHSDLRSNWIASQDGRKVRLIKELLAEVYNTVEVGVNNHRRDMQHARELKLVFSSGKSLFLRLDQGVGYWNPHRSVSFSFNSRIEIQLSEIESYKTSLRVENSQTHPTYVFLKIE